MIDTVRWMSDSVDGLPGKLRLIDQTKLPEELTYLETDNLEEVYDAIKRLVVRGAPAIGCAGALGLAAVAQHYGDDFIVRLEADAQYLISSRPTAVNLEWSIRRCIARIKNESDQSPNNLLTTLLTEAKCILEEDMKMCKAIGEHGVVLFKEGTSVLTHCNAGALATSDYGTALSPIYTAHQNGLLPRVFSGETRPLLQGSRLTAWELNRAGIDVTTICDSMAAQVMREGKIDMVITGADRIASNGDVANKIGTYSVAINAAYHNIPFYVAAPSSTFDLSLADGSGIPIEQRPSEEVSHGFGRQTAPSRVNIYNPAFDVTPASLITGIITEKGIIPKSDFGRIKEILG